MIVLAVAFGLAIVGVVVVVVQRSDAKMGDAIGLMSVVGGVIVAALMNMKTGTR